jgi:hypothetical protein
MNAEQARKQAIEAARDAARAEAHAWSLRMEGYGGPAAVASDRPMPERRLWLPGGEV